MNDSPAPRGAAGKWLLFGFLVMAVILVPFFIAGDSLEAWSEEYLHGSPRGGLWVSAVLIALLAADILLPVPSSLVSLACGALLGLFWGAAVSWIGMTAGCAIGYWLGARAGRPAAHRLVGAAELRRIEGASERLGDWMIVLFRPVPVLAEASAFFAGTIRWPRKRFFLIAAISNMGISLAYAAVGAFSVKTNPFLIACAGSIILPWIAMAVVKRKAP